MTTSQIQQAICKSEVLNKKVVCENVSNLLVHELDVLSYNYNYITEFEVKVSRSDFKRDQKKRKWKYFDNLECRLIPNYFYYACVENLIKENEIPDFAGLVYVNNESVRVIKKARLIHKEKPDRVKVMGKILRLLTQRKHLGSSLVTYKVKQFELKNLVPSSDFQESN